MDSVLTPREIQTRIRSGASLEDVVAVAGLPRERVERFAAPVLAEREHVAAQARAASVRRRGETSGHRTLRAVLADRLRGKGLDIETVRWDSHRLENGRWAVVAAYDTGEEPHQAVFHYDPQGRFSVAADEQARWVLGETGGGGQPVTADAEPTIDLSDDLAIVRAVQESPLHPEAVAEADVLASVQLIRSRPSRPSGSRSASGRTGPADEGSAAGQDTGAGGLAETAEAAAADPVGTQQPTAGADVDAASEPAGAEHRPAAEPSPIATLYEMLGYQPLGGDGYSEDSPRVYEGLSTAGDAPDDSEGATAPPATRGRTASFAPTATSDGGDDSVAVPEAAAGRGAGWEPAIVVAYPVEPGLADEGEVVEVEAPEASDDPGRVEPPVALDDRHIEAEALEDEHEEQQEQRGVPTHPVAAAAEVASTATPEDGEALLEAPAPASPKPSAGRRRRAAVPSWDEIMFGGPKKPG